MVDENVSQIIFRKIKCIDMNKSIKLCTETSANDFYATKKDSSNVALTRRCNEKYD